MFHQAEYKKSLWFEYEPGDATKYVFGICFPPSFTPGISGAIYIQIIVPTGFYQFQFQEIMSATPESFYGYYAKKLNIDEYTAQVIVLFIRDYFEQNNGVDILL